MSPDLYSFRNSSKTNNLIFVLVDCLRSLLDSETASRIKLIDRLIHSRYNERGVNGWQKGTGKGRDGI